MDDLLLVTSLPKPTQGVCILSYFGILAIFMLYLIEAHVTYHLRILLSKKKKQTLAFMAPKMTSAQMDGVLFFVVFGGFFFFFFFFAVWKTR